jgi:hypothetical protein
MLRINGLRNAEDAVDPAAPRSVIRGDHQRIA